MKLFKLSTLAIAVSLSLGTAVPAEANVFNLLLQRKHHAHQRHQQHRQHYEAQNSHGVHHNSNSNHHRVNHYRNRDRNYYWSNHRTRHGFPRRGVYNRHRIYGNWHGRH